MNLDLQVICRYWTEQKGWARSPTYEYVVGIPNQQGEGTSPLRLSTYRELWTRPT